jgi:hypothetical protein
MRCNTDWPAEISSVAMRQQCEPYAVIKFATAHVGFMTGEGVKTPLDRRMHHELRRKDKCRETFVNTILGRANIAANVIA